MAKELLSRPDDFITVVDEEREYIIEGLKTVATHANIDDSVTHLSLKLRECGGNIVR